MNDHQVDQLESMLRTSAGAFPYPPTPDIAGRQRLMLETPLRRQPGRARLAWGAALVVLLFVVSLMSIPAARAAVLEWIQIGVVRIFMGESTPTIPDREPAGTASPAAGLPTAAATPPSLVYDLVSILDLDGETTLMDAMDASPVPLKLPAYPPGLGEPDRVFLQDLEGAMVVLVWTDADDPARARLSLHIIVPGSYAVEKVQPELVQTTQVNGREAIWTVGPYLVHLKNHGLDIRRMVNGHVLIWSEGGITYRLETDLPLDEAVKIAESLKPPE